MLSSSSITTDSDGQHWCHHSPLDLSPLFPISQARRVLRPVARQQEGPGGESPISHRCRVLERLCPPSSSSSFVKVVPPSAYAIDGVTYHNPARGVVLMLGIPTMMNDAGSCLVSCGAPVIIKAVPRPSSNRSDRGAVVDNPLREIAAMQLLQGHHHGVAHHPHVLPLLDCMQDEAFVYLVMPYLSGGDLFSKVETTDGKGLSAMEAASYFRQMAEGLLFMKETCGLAHHDVSLENAMLTSNNDQQGMVQIIDLGMCLRVPKTAVTSAPTAGQQQPVCLLSPQRCSGKPAYVAPEVVREEACDPFASDIWSLGVCLYMMLTARPLYQSPKDQAFKLLSQPGGVHHVVTIYESYGLCLPSCAKDLVCSMLDADPAKRPTLEEVLHHPFLRLGVYITGG